MWVEYTLTTHCLHRFLRVISENATPQILYADIDFQNTAEVKHPRVADPGEFAAEEANIVVKKELPMLEGSFGLLLMLVVKYFIWPPLKYWWGVFKHKWNAPALPLPSTALPETSNNLEQLLMKQFYERIKPSKISDSDLAEGLSDDEPEDLALDLRSR
ncbi:hypothetical protein DAPPUDRAFT_262826 [Daphnia pulex]|uniref:Uncharacterized protein n=1 Tax=Daphnia pulex TaxID=6669 RepID=E9HNR8_DAPPU|nr:hypothetical protein DAPPUDRAFT_262826 [Daphnia pulex]|eukprot:EFX66602.1 hypothetical protein DAPPUDRAFT_262826 [Daphnia pulex]